MVNSPLISQIRSKANGFNLTEYDRFRLYCTLSMRNIAIKDENSIKHKHEITIYETKAYLKMYDVEKRG